MAASYARSRVKLSPLHLLSAALVSITLGAPAAAAPMSEPIKVVLDQALLLRFPARAATVIVGNPLVADLSIQPSGLAVVTGKGYGTTNFIVLDKSGTVLAEKTVEVTIPDDETAVLVYRGTDHGIERQTYSCTPDCSRRLMLGDDPEMFDKTTTQITNRNRAAIDAGTSGR